MFIIDIFEWRLNKIKRKRLIKYLKGLNDNGMDLEVSPLLKMFKGISPSKITEEQARSIIGPMRFYVLKESPYLYQDIASQIHRLRLIHILFLVEVILIVAVCGQLLQGFSWYPICALIFLIVLAIVNVKAAMNRFNRYCRAIERSYRVLVFDY